MAREQRRLAAILAADVVGYSRLMGRDESGTLARLREHRQQRLEPALARHGGRLVKLTGDGALVEFASAVDALSAAIEFQQAVAEANEHRPEDTRIVFRAGLHLGDLIVDGDDLYGDGVNVAARLEAEAPPGGILISRDVHNAVAGRLKADFDDLGGLTLKNIERPVQAFNAKWQPADWKAAASAVAAPSTASASIVNAPLALPDRPSIVVLPFQNMSGDPEQEYFADGIVEDITTALTRTGWLLVTGRNTAFTYRGRAIDLRQVGRELGVRYVLEGSIRKSANRVRITSQLIEAASGNHVWADRFDGELADIFELQDRIAESVVGAIEPTLQRAEIARAAAKPTGSLDAYDLYLRALPLVHVGTRASMDAAVQLLRRALEIDPAYIRVKGYLALVYALREVQWLGELGERSVGTALAREVVATDTDDIEALRGAGIALSVLASDRPAAFAALHRALDLNPNSPQVMETLAIVHCHANDPEPAIGYQKRALQLSPRDSHIGYMLAGLGSALLLAGHTAEALPPLQQAVQQMPAYMSGHRYLILALVRLGRLDEARQAAARLLELRPDVRAGQRVIWVDHVEVLAEMRLALLAAGLPD